VDPPAKHTAIDANLSEDEGNSGHVAAKLSCRKMLMSRIAITGSP